MNDDDFQRISQLLDERLIVSEERSDKKLAALEERSDKKLAALEERLKKHTTASVKQLSADVGEFIAESLLPMIEEKADKSDIDRLERKLDRVLNSSVDHESRIKDIERIPVIAHELKFRKSK